MSSNPVVPFRGRTGTDKSATDAKAAKDYAGAAADRQKRQFEWARSVLEQYHDQLRVFLRMPSRFAVKYLSSWTVKVER